MDVNLPFIRAYVQLCYGEWRLRQRRPFEARPPLRATRDTGQRLYLSHRTVAARLYRIFPKLGITSRAELAAILSDRP
jgi:hypothetical protein